ncbi:Sensor protein EvgS precursor [Marinobacterium sp. xm-v-242]|nr:Sensor protein EvgS precursor [Marinobacterium sp. xm-v-242]NRP76523.1 Sensor protein EvgS precursor [Marinobacterium sp. xm-m-383]
MLIRFLIVGLLQIFVALPVWAQEAIWVFEDTTASRSIEDVVGSPASFVKTTDTHKGFSQSVFWLRVDLTNETAQRQTQVVQFESHLLPKIELYGVLENAAVSGLSIDRAERPLPTLLPSFPIELEAGRSATLHFKITSSFEIELAYGVKTLNVALADNGRFENLRYALTLGLLILLAYNIASAIIIRQALHWLYVVFVSFMLCTQAIEIQLIPLGRHFAAVSGALGLICGTLFLASLFNQLRDKFVRSGIAICTIASLIPLVLYGPAAAYQSLMSLSVPLNLLLLSAQVIVSLVKRKPYSKLVFAGWTAFVGGTVLALMGGNGVLPFEFQSAYAVGSLLEATLFSVLLAYRLHDRDQTVDLLAHQRANNERQKEMFAIIGHELRTPVSIISMVADNADMQPNDKVAQIKSIAENLLNVLEDLRIVVAPERALVAKLELADPVEILKRALSPMSSMLAANGFSLHIESAQSKGQLFEIRSQQFRQCVTNLVKNAALHSGGSEVHVKYEHQVNKNNEVICRVRVEDNGTGIPDTLKNKVFDAFRRGGTNQEGSGLGLFIVKNFAEQMGGTLAYSASEYGGACFELTFPVKAVNSEAQAQAQAQTQTQRAGLSNMRILLAEDDRMLRMLTINMLTKEGAEVSAYENGRLALAAYSPEKFDLVITDLMMPEMNGHELTRKIRSWSSETPIIAVTAAVVGIETDQFLAEGADYVIPKPVSKSALLDALHEINSRRAAGS